MTLWQRIRLWLRPRVIVRSYPPLSEGAMNQALAELPEGHPLWLTLLQLLETAERNAWDDAGSRIAEPTTMAGYVGGSRHLDLLRSDLVRRRKIGLAAIEKGRGRIK